MSYGDRRSEALPLPTTGWVLTRAALSIANVAIAFLLLAPAMFPTPFDPMWGTTSPTFMGVPSMVVLYLAGLGLAIGGRLWMERILRAGREREAHDEFWWSRT